MIVISLGAGECGREDSEAEDGVFEDDDDSSRSSSDVVGGGILDVASDAMSGDDNFEDMEAVDWTDGALGGTCGDAELGSELRDLLFGGEEDDSDLLQL